MKTLRNLFLNELADIYDAEKRLIGVLPRFEKASATSNLRRALRRIARETRCHVIKLEKVFQQFGVAAKSRPCEATIGLLREADEVLSEFRGSPAIDAAVISAAQKIKHYKIASYGCLREWSEVLGRKPATDIFLALLGQERAADEMLTCLAREGSNQQAYGESAEEHASGTINREMIAAG